MGIPEAEGQKAIELSTKPEDRLTPRELAAYRFWAKSGQPRLAPTLQAQLFDLFLQGKTVEEILKVNKGLTLAQVTTARVEGEWDLRRDEYLHDLMVNTRSVLQQSTLEAVNFMTDILAVVHKKYGQAARLYLQTGDEKHLKGFDIGSIGQYKAVVEVLQKLSGVDQQPKRTEEKVSGEIVHRHQVEQPIVDVRGPMKSTDAHQALQAALGSGGK